MQAGYLWIHVGKRLGMKKTARVAEPPNVQHTENAFAIPRNAEQKKPTAVPLPFEIQSGESRPLFLSL